MKAFIFDLDGTLLDSMGVWEQIDRDFLRKRNIPIPSDYIDTVCSLSFQEAARYTIARFGLPDTEADLLREWNDMAVFAYGHTVKLKPYARQYLKKLKAAGVSLGVATSLPPELYFPVLHNQTIFDFFDVICSTDEVTHGKTKPDIFYHTAEKLNIPPSHCIVFEDVLQAIQSAKTAGMTVYGVYDPSSADHWEEIKKIADGVLYDFKDALLPT